MTEEEIRKTVFEKIEQKYKLHFREHLIVGDTITEMLAELTEKDKQIEALKDKVEMLDFFYEGNGFKTRGLNNSIQIAEYIKKLEKENKELKENYDIRGQEIIMLREQLR